MSWIVRCDAGDCQARRIARWVGVPFPPIGWHTIELENGYEAHACSDKCRDAIKNKSLADTPTSSEGIALP